MLSATVRKFRTVRKEGNRMVTRNMDYYNLDMIINPIKSKYFSFERRQVQSDTAMRNNSGGFNLQAPPCTHFQQYNCKLIPITARRSHPAKHGEGFDAPPTL